MSSSTFDVVLENGLWFDGLGNQESYNGRRYHKLIRESQPSTLINNRIGLAGDYATPEQFIPKTIPQKGSNRQLSGTQKPKEAAAGGLPRIRTTSSSGKPA